MAKIFVVEHLDPELGPWSALEYQTIAAECKEAGAGFCLSSIATKNDLPSELQEINVFAFDSRSVDQIYAKDKAKVCLLDAGAKQKLAPEDGDAFDVFLFGGILGDDPPRDRTSELRKKGFEGRNLGSVQMTTDTAVRVTRMVVQDRVSLKDIPYIDFPELKLDEHESTEMPFRYVKKEDGSPFMPKGMIDLIKKDADKGLEDLL